MGLSCIFLFLFYFGDGIDVTEQIRSHLFIISCSDAGMSQKVEEKTTEVGTLRVL